MSDELYTLDLASERVGGAAVATNDDFFAAVENLVSPTAPVFIPDKYVSTGKWMDGWESRRRRQPGDDWAIIRLGLRGIIRRLIVDTSHFVGNYPEECAVEACCAPAQATEEQLQGSATRWTEIVGRSPLKGDSHNAFEAQRFPLATHLRLRIFPDGGVARLRAFGDVRADWATVDASYELVDLAAIAYEGRVVAQSDAFFGVANNMLMPGDARNMGDGWETRRRRDAGHDWATIALGRPGRISRAIVDTRHFKGNAPGRCTLEVCKADGAAGQPPPEPTVWQSILEDAQLLPHTVHIFSDELEEAEATHARLRIFPDGGIARLRLFGRSLQAETMMATLQGKNGLARETLREELHACCGSTAWAAAMAEKTPFLNAGALMKTADREWLTLGETDWLEAFAAHPKIGEKRGASAWSSREQRGVADASDEVARELEEQNAAYEKRFGFIYIICATGRSADEMLTALRARLQNPRDTELQNAAEEQRKITRLRLEKWLTE